MDKEKVLILGSSGFTGYYFRQFLLSSKLDDSFIFLGIDNNSNDHTDIPLIKIDILDYVSLEKVICDFKPQYILNFAGTFNTKVFEELVNINSFCIKNISEIIIRNDIRVKKIVTVGSAAEYGKPTSLPVTEEGLLNPTNLYGLSKVIQSNISKFYFENHGIPIIIARTFNIAGKNLSPNLSIGSFAQQIKSIETKGEISVGELNVIRDFTSIKEVVKAYWLLLISGKDGDIYNVCSGHPSKLVDLVYRMINYSGKDITLRLDKTRNKHSDTDMIIGSNEKIKREVNWSPSEAMLDLTLKEMIEG